MNPKSAGKMHGGSGVYQEAGGRAFTILLFFVRVICTMGNTNNPVSSKTPIDSNGTVSQGEIRLLHKLQTQDDIVSRTFLIILSFAKRPFVFRQAGCNASPPSFLCVCVS